MRIRLITWNINSLRKRIDMLGRLVERVAPDVVCLQETKVPDEKFPHEAVAALGFEHRVIRGYKGYNGVAILSRLPFAAAGHRDWCGRDDARNVHATVADGLEIDNFYVPAGGDEPDPEINEKFAHKLQFMTELAAWGRGLPRNGVRRILVGDLNVAPLETDVWSHKQLRNVVSHTAVEIAHLTRAQDAHGWIDAMRAFVPPEERLYSWWSYRARDWATSNRGRRLDHVWVSPALAPTLTATTVLQEVRGWDTPSDHAPVMTDLELQP